MDSVLSATNFELEYFSWAVEMHLPWSIFRSVSSHRLGAYLCAFNLMLQYVQSICLFHVESLLRFDQIVKMSTEIEDIGPICTISLTLTTMSPWFPILCRPCLGIQARAQNVASYVGRLVGGNWEG